MHAIRNSCNNNLCRHSLVVMVFLSMSRQMGHISSLCKLRGDTAISVLSVITSWGVLCSSYKLNSHVLFDIGACSITGDNGWRAKFTSKRNKHKSLITTYHKKPTCSKHQFPVPEKYRKRDLRNISFHCILFYLIQATWPIEHTRVDKQTRN